MNSFNLLTYLSFLAFILLYYSLESTESNGGAIFISYASSIESIRNGQNAKTEYYINFQFILCSIINQKQINIPDERTQPRRASEGALLLHPRAMPAHPESALLPLSGLPRHHARKDSLKINRRLVQPRLPHDRRRLSGGPRRHRNHELPLQKVQQSRSAGPHSSNFRTFPLTQAKTQEILVRHSL